VLRTASVVVEMQDVEMRDAELREKRQWGE